jgi:hypothetical protein
MAHAEVGSPGGVPDGHGDRSTLGQQREHPVSLGLGIGDNHDVEVRSKGDDGAEALDHVASHEVHDVRQGQLDVHDLVFGMVGHGAGPVGLPEGLDHRDLGPEDLLIVVKGLPGSAWKIEIEVSKFHGTTPY